MNYTEAFVQREQYRIYMREYAGDEPVVILLHGFPDNMHLYDRLIPCLCPPRRVVAFDFLGWGESDKPSGYPYTSVNQIGDYQRRPDPRWRALSRGARLSSPDALILLKDVPVLVPVRFTTECARLI